MTRHSWGKPDRPDEHNIIRVCKRCGIRKVGRHEGGEHWSEYFTADGKRIDMKDTPICTGRRP